MYQALDEVLGLNGALSACYYSLADALNDASEINEFLKKCYYSVASVLDDASNEFLLSCIDCTKT
jgi:hypothetical protein